MYGFKKIYVAPKRSRGATSPKARYCYEQSYRRFELREDAYLPGEILVGEIGRIEGVRFIYVK